VLSNVSTVACFGEKSPIGDVSEGGMVGVAAVRSSTDSCRGIYCVGVSGSPIRRDAGGVIVDVWVVPGASHSQIVGLHGDKLKLRVTAPPEGGRANEEARMLLEGLFGGSGEFDQGNV
jgi:uncharacterized protein (TIGR00251 family)